MRTKHPELGMCGFLEYYKKKKPQTFRIRILWPLRIIYIYFLPGYNNMRKNKHPEN